MRRVILTIVLMIGLLAGPVAAQETPASIAKAYDAMADTILSLRQAELHFVASMLDGHRHAAKVRMKNGDWEGAAGEIALFANEGDNSIGGVRKRLLEGGHHFNAEGEEQGVFEPGYVIVTREAKEGLLKLATALRQAETDDERKTVWKDFVTLSEELLSLD